MRKKTSGLLEVAGVALCLCLVTAYFYSLCYGHTRLTVFQARDISRAAQWWNGPPVLRGPELNAAGRIPGPFYYWLLSIPLLLGGGWRHLIYLCFGLSVVAAGTLWIWIRALWGNTAGLFTSFLYMTSLPISIALLEGWNPSYLPLFSMACSLGVVTAFSKSGRTQKNAWILSCISFTLALQIHLSSALFVIFALVLQGLSSRLRLKAIPTRTFWAGLAIPAPFLGVYLYDLLLIPRLHPRAYLSSWDALVQVIFRPNRAVGDHSFWKRISDAQWDQGFWMATALVLVVWLIGLKKKRRNVALDTPTRVLLSLWVLAFLSVYPWVLDYHYRRYLIHFDILSIILLGVWAGRALPQKTSRRSQAARALLFAGTLMLLTGFWQDMRKLGEPQAPVTNETLASTWFDFTVRRMDELCPFFLRELGGDPVRIRKSLFVLHMMPQQTFLDSAVRLSFCGRPDSTKAFQEEPPENFSKGWILSLEAGFMRSLTPSSWKEWLLKQRIPAEMSAALREGKLTLEPPVFLRSTVLLPYRMLHGECFPNSFHNLGSPYSDNPVPELPEGYAARPTGAYSLGDDSYLFLWNNCLTSDEEFCQTGVRVKLVRRGPLLLSQIRVFGPALGQNSSILHPPMTQGLSHLRMALKCDGKSRVTTLAQKVGNAIHHPLPALLAPVDFEFELPCRKVERIGISTDASEIYDGRVRTQPGSNLELDLAQAP